MEQNSLKKKIYEVAVETLESAAERTRLAIEEAIQAAQEEVNTLDIYESYRSQYLQKSEMFAIQYNKILEQLDVLRKINPEDEFKNVVVYISREMYHAIVDEWLDHKASYNKLCEGSFAGVGRVSINELEELDDQCNLLHWVKDDKEEFGERAEYKNVRTFIGYNFEIDMEHG